jgi:hypothetical protein
MIVLALLCPFLDSRHRLVFFVHLPGFEGRPLESATVALRYRITDPPPRRQAARAKPIGALTPVKARGEEKPLAAIAAVRKTHAESEYLARDSFVRRDCARRRENFIAKVKPHLRMNPHIPARPASRSDASPLWPRPRRPRVPIHRPMAGLAARSLARGRNPHSRRRPDARERGGPDHRGRPRPRADHDARGRPWRRPRRPRVRERRHGFRHLLVHARVGLRPDALPSRRHPPQRRQHRLRRFPGGGAPGSNRLDRDRARPAEHPVRKRGSGRRRLDPGPERLGGSFGGCRRRRREASTRSSARRTPRGRVARGLGPSPPRVRTRPTIGRTTRSTAATSCCASTATSRPPCP